MLNGWAARGPAAAGRIDPESAGDAAAGDEQTSVSVQDADKASGFISRQSAHGIRIPAAFATASDGAGAG